MATAKRAVELVLSLQGNSQRTCQRCGVTLHENRQQTCQSGQTRYLLEFVEILHVHSQGACQTVCDCCMRAVNLQHVDVIGVITAYDPAKVWPKSVKVTEDCMGTKRPAKVCCSCMCISKASCHPGQRLQVRSETLVYTLLSSLP